MNDIEVNSKDEVTRAPKYDMFLRKFQYTKALDAVLVKIIMKKKPAVTVGVMHELIRYFKNYFITFVMS